jgi:hypothetical protein
MVTARRADVSAFATKRRRGGVKRGRITRLPAAAGAGCKSIASSKAVDQCGALV